jgi:hypothetical protein
MPTALGVHSRTHRDGDGETRECLKAKYLLEQHCSDRAVRKVYTPLIEGDCAWWVGDRLQKVVEHYRLPRAGAAPFPQRPAVDGVPPFRLIHDNGGHTKPVHDWSADRRAVQPPPVSKLDFLPAKPNWGRFRADGGKRHTFPGRAVFTPAKAHILDVATVLHDAWSMVPVDFFAGESYSTLSLTICMLRGEARKFDSTMCWLLMHPGRQSAESPPGLPPHAS